MYAVYRPRLYCALVLEIFNRIMHEVEDTPGLRKQRDDLVLLADLGNRIVCYD